MSSLPAQQKPQAVAVVAPVSVGSGEALSDEIALYEAKARWCDEYGYPADALEHWAYIAQLRRRAGPAHIVQAFRRANPDLAAALDALRAAA